MARIGASTLFLGIVAVMFGLLGAYVVRKELHKAPAPAAAAKPAEPEKVFVPLAGRDLPAGHTIAMSDVSVYRLTREEMKTRGVKGEFMSNTQQIIGRVLKAPLNKGSTFDTEFFYPDGTGPTVAEKLAPGLRAVTITVEVPAAVSGFASPGSRVDVYFRADADTKAELPETTITLIEGVEVLAFNAITTQGARTAPTDMSGHREAQVTLAVDPRQAAALRVVDGRGTLSLALRHPDDKVAAAGATPRTLEELLERPNHKYRIEVYRGRQMSRIEFKDQQRMTPTPRMETQNVAAPAPPAEAAQAK